MDIDEAEELVEAYRVTAVPHLVVLRGGVLVAQYVGSQPDELEAIIVEALARAI